MGTNYYAVEAECPTPCAHCAQDELHIGKSLTMFQQHETSPWGTISDWSDWKRIFRNCASVSIRDEYGNRHDPVQFVEDVESTNLEDRGRQFRWLVEHSHPLDRDYLDSFGFSWHRGEFS